MMMITTATTIENLKQYNNNDSNYNNNDNTVVTITISQ